MFQAKVFTQAVCLTEELCGRLEELSGNRDGTTAHEGVSDVFLPTQLGGSCQCFSKAAMRTDDPVAQFGERKIAQVVGYRSLQTNLLRDAQGRLELLAGAGEITLIHREQPEIVERRLQPGVIPQPLVDRLGLFEESARLVVASVCSRDAAEQVH